MFHLANAIYFNATWKYQFDTEDTYQGTFHLEDGTGSEADFMVVEGGFNLTSNEYFTSVELPYGDSAFSMVILLPTENHTVENLVDAMSFATWEDWFATSSPRNLRIELPKFTYGFKDLLNDPLIELGLGVAFGGDADFSQITPGAELYISRVIHQTFIDVSEEGTEAAAATIVELREFSAAGPAIFKADKPFLYVIKENSTSAILFMGKVGKPVHE